MKKKLVVITGASSGIGQALAKTFSEAGHPLLLLARREERLKAMNLPNTLCERVDVTHLDSFKKAIEKAEKEYGDVDCLINNAGVMLLGNVNEQDPDEWKRMIDVNIMGVMNGVNAVLQKMIKKNHGTIVNISSVAGRKTFPQHAAYCATKFAVHAFSENIREEIANNNIRVITIAPGVVKTELLNHTTSEKIVQEYRDWASKTEMELLTPEDVAETIVFAYNLPQRVCVREVVICPTKQPQ